MEPTVTAVPIEPSVQASVVPSTGGSKVGTSPPLRNQTSVRADDPVGTTRALSKIQPLCERRSGTGQESHQEGKSHFEFLGTR